MSEDSFQIESVIKHFEECLHEENDIDLMTYVRAYEELSRLFNILGIIFSFVESDVKEKREILKQLYEKDNESYKSVNSMVEYEIVPGQKPKNIGCRTLLRLHRALEFLILFVEDVHRSKPDDNISELFRDAYEKSLSQHHGWLIRKTVQLASHAVPSRDFLIKVIFAHGEEPTPEQLESIACKFVKVVQDVYDRMVELDQVYVEEKQLGLNLCNKPAVFGSQNKIVFVIAAKNIVAFNAKNGKRIAILKYPEQQLALLVLENKPVSVTSNGCLLTWDLEKQVLMSNYNFSKDKIDFAYTTADGFYCVSIKEKKTTVIRKLVLTPEGNVDSFIKVGEIPQPITNPKHLAITDLFAVIVSSRVRLECHPFDNYKVKASNYVCHGYFQNLEKQTLLSFEQVIFINGVLYASLNTGRIYYWKKFAQTGFDPSSISHFHRNQSAAAFAIGSHGALYCGGGEASVRKWNLSSTGAGRWQSAENVEKFDAPINEISLSPDGTVLAVQLEDNTVWIIQTSTMTILCELQTMQWMPHGHWLPLKVDPVRPDLIMTSGRIGHLQWFDPTKWRTVAFYDITEEDTPPRDNIPYGLIHDWLNIYEVNASPSTLVTAEKRRRSKDLPSLLKFFRRNPKASLADLKIEDSIEFSGEVFRILSSHDDLSVDEAFAAIKEEEIVIIEKTGKITVFIRDIERSGRWLQDMSRTVDWMDSKIVAVSAVRRNCFAAVHKVENKTGMGNYILIWRLDDLSIHETIDSLQNVTAVEWAPYTPETENVLLTVTFKSISAYNVASKSVLWVITVPQVKLFASMNICCCYVKNRVYVIDALTGDLKMQTEFEEPKKEVVATVSGKNVRFIGKSSNTRLSLLKIENAENEADREVVSMVKKTPFAELVEQARELEQAYKKIQTFKIPSFKQQFEGAIYTSAPITKIGPEYIRQCLIKRDPLDFEY